MYCRDIMIDRTEVITVTEEYTLANALKRMDLYGFRALPVSNYGRLVGTIDLFSIYEHLYVKRDVDFDKATVKDVMQTDFAFVYGTDVIETAARLLTNQRVMFIPVLQDDTDDQFMGIIPVNRLMQMFMSAVGYSTKGSRITVVVKNEKGALARLTRQLLRAGANIEGLLPITRMPGQGIDENTIHVIVKFEGDLEKVSLACQDAGMLVITKDDIE